MQNQRASVIGVTRVSLLLGLLVLFIAANTARAQIQIGADEAATLILPTTSGDGVFIDVYNQIGGGRAPLPSDVDSRDPTGSTLSPFIDFPRPGTTINVGQSFTTFFASTAIPPEELRNTAARNFILDITFLMRVGPEDDRNMSTPGIDLSLRVGSDDGFYFLVGDTFVASTGDRSFGWSAYSFEFESPGLYPVRLLFAANAVGFSGLEFQWYTAPTGGWAFVPQSALYLAETGCIDEFTFDDIDLGDVPANQYVERGIVFDVASGGVVVTDARPLEFIPVSGDRVIGDPDLSGSEPGLIGASFWAFDPVGGDYVPGEVDEVGLFVINANDRDGGTGARVTANGLQQSTLFDQVYNAGVGTQEQVSIVAPGMIGLRLELGAGLSAAAIDSLCVGPIRPAPADLAGDGGVLATGTLVFGGNASVSWTVTNLGGLPPAVAWAHAVYLSQDGVLGPEDHLLADSIPGGDLGFTDTLPFDEVVTLPLDLSLPDGSYHFIVVLDDTNAINEIDETNNVLIGDPVTIERPALPNLVPEGVAAAELGTFVSGTIDVTWTVRNVGDADANGIWTDRIYLSQDDMLDESDTLLEPEEFISGPVAAQIGIYQRRVVYTTPALPLGEYRLIVEVNADDGATELENRSDNVTVGSSPISIVSPPMPDLEVTALTPPANLPPGSAVELSWTIRNNGPGPVDAAWTERVIGSLDSVLGNGNDQDVASFTYAQQLGPGESVQRFETITIPSVPPGGYWAIVQVDSGNTVAEANESNNVRAAEVCVNCQTPDLVVETVSGPPTGTAGSSAVVSWTVRNINAGGASGGWTDRVYLSTDPDAGSDSLLGEVRWTSGLAGSTSYDRQLNVAIPPETEGAIWFVVVTDAINELSEPGGEGNNAGVAQSETIVNLPDLPDLAVASAVLETSDPVFGDMISFSMTVTNSGTADAVGSWIDRAFLSRDTILDTSDVPLLPTRPAPVTTLAPSGSYGATLDVTLPLSASLDEGEYYLLAQTDGGSLILEQRESNNTIAVGPFIVSRPPLPDLGVASISTPSGGNPGETVDVFWTTQNSGGARATAPWRERLFVVTENGSEFLAASFDAAQDLDAGALTEPRSASVTVPESGITFRVRIRVDTNGQVLESGEDNNALTSGAAPIYRPDVLVSNVAADPSATAGEPINISWEIANVGMGDTYTYFIDRVSIKNGGVNHFLGIYPHNTPLASGEVDPVSLSFPLPDRIEGEYLIVIQTDSTDRLIESGPASNNTGVSSGTIQVTQPPRADLVVESITPPSDGLVGSEGVVSWTVRNVSGDTASEGPWIDRVVGVPADDSGGQIVQLALVTRQDDLAPGDTYEGSATVRMPGLAGIYEIEVITDNGDQVNEGLVGGEDNNVTRGGIFEASTYLVTASASIENGIAGTPVSVAGQALDLGGVGIADVPVSVHYCVQGTIRRLTTATNASGGYVVNLPLSRTEAGRYELFAGATREETDSIQFPSDAFTLFGISTNALLQGPSIVAGSTGGSNIQVRNSGDTPLAGLSIAILDAPPGVEFSADTSDGTLAPRERRQVPYEITVDSIVQPGIYRLTLQSTTAQGASSVSVIEFQVRTATARLVPTPGTIRTGMLRSTPDEPRMTTVEFSVRNTGGAPTGPIDVLLPSTSWMSLASPATMSSLEPGESAGVVLNLLPGSTLPLGPYTGNLVLDPENGVNRSVPYEINLVSDGVGDFEIVVEDEVTYYGNGANNEPLGPRVGGASVQLFRASDGSLFASSMTDSDGRSSFIGLPEGAYEVVVSEPNHKSERLTLGIFRGELSSASVFLYRRMVRYTWDVDPFAIDDTYRIILNAEFETFVPFPVLEVTPGYVDLTQLVGQTAQIDFTIENKGLVKAEQVEIGVGTDGRWIVTPLISDIGEIPAGQSVTVPVIFEDTFQFLRGDGSGTGGQDADDPCSFRVSMSVAHRKYCGPVLRTYSTGVQFRLPDVFCPGGGVDPPPGFTWGDGDDSDDPPPNNQGPNNNASAPPCGCYEIALVFFTGGSNEAQGSNDNFINKGHELEAQYPGRVTARTFPSSHCTSTRADEAASWVRTRNAPDCPCGDPKVILVGHSAGGDTAHYSAANPRDMDVAYTLLIDPVNRDIVNCFACLDLVDGDETCVAPDDRTNQRNCFVPGPIDEVHISDAPSPIPIGCGVFGQTTNQSWGYSVPGAVEVQMPPGSNHNNASSRGYPWENSIDDQVQRLLDTGCGGGG